MIVLEPAGTTVGVSTIRHGILVGALLTLVTTGCSCVVTCNDNGCEGSLSWTATTADEMPMVAGEYTLEVELEGDRFSIDCSVADDGSGQCGSPVQTAGDRNFELRVDWFGEHTFTMGQMDGTNTMVTQHGIHLMVVEHVEKGVRGPSTVMLTLARGPEVVLEDGHALEYERDETFHGDERCGFCDLPQSRETTFSQ